MRINFKAGHILQQRAGYGKEEFNDSSYAARLEPTTKPPSRAFMSLPSCLAAKLLSRMFKKQRNLFAFLGV